MLLLFRTKLWNYNGKILARTYIKDPMSLFYLKNHLEKTTNIKLHLNKLIFDKPVKFNNINNRVIADAHYFTNVIKSNPLHEPQFFLYFRSDVKYFRSNLITKTALDEVTICMQSKDLENFHPVKSKISNNAMILRDGLASHNFTVLNNDKNGFLGIGGKHLCLQMIRAKKNPPYFKNYPDCGFQKLNVKAAKYKGVISIANPNYLDKNKCNGLYLYKSADGVNFELKESKPVLSGINKNPKIDHMYGFGTFDSINSFIFFKGKYFLYARANIGFMKRFVKYSISTDLKVWTSFEWIRIEGLLPHNTVIYSPVMKVLEDVIIAVCPTIICNNNKITKDIGLLLMSSEDGIKWQRHGFLIRYNVKLYSGRLLKAVDIHKMMSHIMVNGDIYHSFENNNLILLLHETLKKRISRYYLKNKCFILLSSKKENLVSEFKTQRCNFIKKSLSVDCQVNKDGFIQFAIVDIKGTIIHSFKDSEPINGIHFNKILKWKNEFVSCESGQLICQFKNSTIFGIHGLLF